MEITTIQVEERTGTGTRQVTQLRAQGKVPAVLYGEGKPVVLLAVAEREFRRHVRQHHQVFLLRLGERERAIYLQDVQWDPLTDRPLHLDFKRISLEDRLHLKVEISFVGHAAGLAKGGRFVKDLTELKVAALPAAIPNRIEVPVAHLELGMKVLASEVVLPDGVSLEVPPDTLICHVPAEIVRIPVAEPEAPPLGEGEKVEPTLVGREKKAKDEDEE